MLLPNFDLCEDPMSDPTRDTDTDSALDSQAEKVHDNSAAKRRADNVRGTGKRARASSDGSTRPSVSDEAANVPVYREESARSDSEDAIRTRAYYRYLDRGAGPGDELQDWLEAQREERDRAGE